jgi:hypothetical protein
MENNMPHLASSVANTPIEKRKSIIKAILRRRPLELIFIKSDGTERSIYASLQDNDIPDWTKKTDRVLEKPSHLLSVVDLKLNEWRTVNVSTLVGIGTQPERPFSFADIFEIVNSLDGE